MSMISHRPSRGKKPSALRKENRQSTLWTPLALRPVMQGHLDIKPLITHRFPISRVAQAFAVAANDPTAITMVIEPDR
jgi:L-iditol 2-dehydrogenase